MRRLLNVKIRGSVYSVPQEEIIYLENELRKICLHMRGREVLFYGTFKEILKELDERFLLCSRSYIVNMDHVLAMHHNGNYEIEMDSGEHLFFSKNYYLKAKAVLEGFLKEKT